MYVCIYTTLGFHAGDLRVFFYRGSFLTTEHDPGAVAAGTAVLPQQKGWQGTVVTPHVSRITVTCRCTALNES